MASRATTIDKLDIGIYVQYARMTQFREEIERQYGLGAAGQIAPHTIVVDIDQRPTSLDALMGVGGGIRYSEVAAPAGFFAQHRSVFTTHCVVPSLGSEERHEADVAKVSAVKCRSPEARQEQSILKNLYDVRGDLNDQILYIFSHIGQFLQG